MRKNESRKWFNALLFLLTMSLSIFSLSLQNNKPCKKIRPDCPLQIRAAQFLENDQRNLFITDLSEKGGADNALAILNTTEAQKVDVLPLKEDSDVVRLIPNHLYDNIMIMEIGAHQIKRLQEHYGDQMSLFGQQGGWEYYLVELE